MEEKQLSWARASPSGFTRTLVSGTSFSQQCPRVCTVGFFSLWMWKSALPGAFPVWRDSDSLVICRILFVTEGDNLAMMFLWTGSLSPHPLMSPGLGAGTSRMPSGPLAISHLAQKAIPSMETAQIPHRPCPPHLPGAHGLVTLLQTGLFSRRCRDFFLKGGIICLVFLWRVNTLLHSNPGGLFRTGLALLPGWQMGSTHGWTAQILHPPLWEGDISTFGSSQGLSS